MAIDTKRGQIWEALVARLKTMTVAGGYHWNVLPTSVVATPENILLIPVNALPFFVVELSAGNSREYHAANQIEPIVRFVITARMDATGNDPMRKPTIGEHLVGDIEKVLEADITLGGLVHDLRMVEPDGPLMGGGADQRVLTLVELEAHFHREYGMP